MCIYILDRSFEFYFSKIPITHFISFSGKGVVLLESSNWNCRILLLNESDSEKHLHEKLLLWRSDPH